MHRRQPSLFAFVIVSLAVIDVIAARAQSSADSETRGPVDLCGQLVSDGQCVLFESGGGRWVLDDFAGFRAGDSVRVVGTADPSCRTICDGADGCIRGATLYNVSVYPCGTHIPSLGEDLIPALTSTVCSAVSGALIVATLASLRAARSVRLPRRT